MPDHLLVLGQITVDHVVPAEPGPWVERIGGNALYAAAGARLWLEPARIRVVSRIGRGFPADAGAMLAGAGIAEAALVPAGVEHLVEWFLYEEDGSRRTLPRNPGLRGEVGDGSAGRARYLAHLEALSPAAVDIPAAWLPAGVVHLAPQVEARHRETVRALAGRAGLVAVDPSPHYAGARDAPALCDLLAPADALLPSEQEVRHLLAVAGGDRAAVAAALVRAGFAEVVLKAGARGAFVGTARGVVHVPSLPVRPVDPTGAGDAFCGAYAACRLRGIEPREAARRAAVAAAMVVSCSGAAAALALDPAEARARLARAA